jgi:hypothetical protein
MISPEKNAMPPGGAAFNVMAERKMFAAINVRGEMSAHVSPLTSHDNIIVASVNHRSCRFLHFAYMLKPVGNGLLNFL